MLEPKGGTPYYRILSGREGLAGRRRARAACNKLSADELLYRYEIDRTICVQLVPIERSLI